MVASGTRKDTCLIVNVANNTSQRPRYIKFNTPSEAHTLPPLTWNTIYGWGYFWAIVIYSWGITREKFDTPGCNNTPVWKRSAILVPMSKPFICTAVIVNMGSTWSWREGVSGEYPGKVPTICWSLYKTRDTQTVRYQPAVEGPALAIGYDSAQVETVTPTHFREPQLVSLLEWQLCLLSVHSTHVIICMCITMIWNKSKHGSKYQVYCCCCCFQ